MARASCAGPLPECPHSKPVGLWLNSLLRGGSGRLWPLLETTTRQPAVWKPVAFVDFHDAPHFLKLKARSNDEPAPPVKLPRVP